jgi:hypothetical protein
MVDSGRLYVDKAYAASLTPAQLRVPVLVITVRHPNGTVYQDICDGNHRVYQAWRLGHETYPAIALSESESDSFRFPDEFVKMLILSGELK